LPAQHPVGEEIDAGGLLDGDELREVALDLVVVRFRCRAPTVEVARRLDERLRPRVDPWYESLQIRLLQTKTASAKEVGSGARSGLFRRFC
jgi:hypothetical protein